MEIEELRRGNLVFIQGEIKKVLGFFNEMARNSDETVDFVQADNLLDYLPYDLKPIPLSEEILLKVGFGWNIGKSAMWNEHDFLIGQDDEGFFFAQWQYDSNEDPYPSHIVHVNTLHDLQNLHKIITGKELNTSGLTKND